MSKGKIVILPFFGNAAGSINISNILIGKYVAKVKAKNVVPLDECKCSGNNVICIVSGGRSCKCGSRKRIRASRMMPSIIEALRDIKTLFT